MTDINRVALAGEFAVLSQLALRGYDANLTLGNTKGVDILVSDPSSRNMCRLEVKTTSKKPGNSRIWGNTLSWVMSRKHESIVDPILLYCFVALEDSGFRYFVVPSEVVASYVRHQHQVWLEGDPKRKNTSMRAFRILVDPSGNELGSPLASEYEDAWELLSH